MKKWLAALLCMMLALPAFAEGKLDEAFEHGPSFVKYEYEFQDADAYTLNIPEALKAEYGDAVLTNEMLTKVSVKEVSPDGKTVILGYDDDLYILRENVVTPVWFDPLQPIGDMYQKIAMYLENLERFIGAEGFTWSHNGRYAVAGNIRFLQRLLPAPPVVIDTDTGKAFIVSPSPEIDSTLICTAFDAQDQYLYYTTYVKHVDYRYVLMRADVSTWKAEVCLNVANEIYSPRLCALKDGSFMAVDCTVRSYEVPKLVTFSNKWGKMFTVRIRPFMAKAEIFTPSWMEYSAESGWGLVLGGARSLSQIVARIQPDNKFANINDYWAFELVNDEVCAVHLDDPQTYVLEHRKAESTSACTILGIRISPDGKYAFISAYAQETVSILVRLDDMTAKRIDGEVRSSIYMTNETVTWCAEDTLLVSGKLYRIQ